MKSWFYLSLIFLKAGSALAQPPVVGSLPPPPEEVLGELPKPVTGPAQFMSTVQMAIVENDPTLMRRSQDLVREQMLSGFQAFPQLSNRRYEIRTTGNEVVFYLVTNDDMRAPMQQAVASMISNLNGRVRARGRSLFYRTTPQRPIGGYLEVVVNDVHTKVRSIAAQSVLLRDVLKELRAQLGSLSYLIPGDCADRRVDWSFGE